jgi:hypothetical protein
MCVPGCLEAIAQGSRHGLLAPPDRPAGPLAPSPSHRRRSLERVVDLCHAMGPDFPGFHLEAAALLIERDAVGLEVDTLSFDHGPSRDFGAHCVLALV